MFPGAFTLRDLCEMKDHDARLIFFWSRQAKIQRHRDFLRTMDAVAGGMATQESRTAVRSAINEELEFLVKGKSVQEIEIEKRQKFDAKWNALPKFVPKNKRKRKKVRNINNAI